MNVLIPTDFSENSKNAMRYAMDFFADCSVRFYMLHVSSPNSAFQKRQQKALQNTWSVEKPTSPKELLEEEVKNYRLLARNSEHEFFTLEKEGSLIEVIRSRVEQQEINLIVMGTKGNAGMEQDSSGSKTYEVITKVKCPIMVVPDHARMEKIKNISFITDYNNIYRNKVISTLSKALQLHEAPLRILHLRPKISKMTSEQVDNKGFLHYFFRDTKHSFHFLENQHADSGIQEFIDTWEISIVAIAARNLNFIQRLMLRPVSEGITYHSENPFLVLHE